MCPKSWFHSHFCRFCLLPLREKGNHQIICWKFISKHIYLSKTLFIFCVYTHTMHTYCTESTHKYIFFHIVYVPMGLDIFWAWWNYVSSDLHLFTPKFIYIYYLLHITLFGKCIQDIYWWSRGEKCVTLS